MKYIQARKKIKVPLYGGMLDIVVSNSDSVLPPSARNFNVHDPQLLQSEAVCLRRTDDSPARIYPVLFSVHITEGMIAHESKHLVNQIFKDVGIKLDIDNDESEAYLLMWIVNRITEVRWKFNKEVKKYEERSRTPKNQTSDEGFRQAVGYAEYTKDCAEAFNSDS